MGDLGRREATLADVYDLDMGARVEDLPLWRELLYGADHVAEVGCGTGRVPVGLALLGWSCARWAGIDPDPGMVSRFRARMPHWAGCVEGDACDPGTWAAVRRGVGGPLDAVIVPYSTLFLVPHERQVDLLRLAGGSVRPGGLVAAEVFVPLWTDTAVRGHMRRCAGGAPALDPWVVQVEYRVDGSTRTTAVERAYGPVDQPPRLVCRERLHWRLPGELQGLAAEAGLGRAQVLRGGSVPRGFAVLAARV